MYPGVVIYFAAIVPKGPIYSINAPSAGRKFGPFFVFICHTKNKLLKGYSKQKLCMYYVSA
jgi:hypothetical protein